MARTLEEKRAADREASRRYRKEHPGQAREANRKWRATNKAHACELHRNWSKNNPERWRAIKYKAKYGITLEDYEQLLTAQGGVCAICGTEPGKNRLHVDHDHSNGKVRGLLCRKCNMGLGSFGDSPEQLRKALEYISLGANGIDRA